MNEQDVCDILKASVDLLRQMFPAAYHRWTPGVLTITGNSSTHVPTTRPDFRSTLMDLFARGTQPPVLQDFTSVIESDNRFASVPIRPDNLLPELVSEYLFQLDELAYEDTIARQIASSFLGCLSTGKTEIVLFTVVRGLDYDGPPVELLGRVTLRCVPTHERAAILDRTAHHQALLKDGFERNECLLEYRATVLIGKTGGADVDAQKAFNQIITALRVIKGGTVERENCYIRPSRAGQVGCGDIRFFREGGKFTIYHEYKLAETDLPGLKRVLAVLKRDGLARKLRTALDRLNFAAGRAEPEDQLVDLFVAMESLFGEGGGSIRYKVAMRCAAFVADEPSERELTFRQIERGYTERNNVVHGSQTNKTQLRSLVASVRELARRSIFRFIEHAEHGNNLPSMGDIDNSLLETQRVWAKR